MPNAPQCYICCRGVDVPVSAGNAPICSRCLTDIDCVDDGTTDPEIIMACRDYECRRHPVFADVPCRSSG